MRGFLWIYWLLTLPCLGADSLWTAAELRLPPENKGCLAWEDAGTHDSLIGAGELIRVFEQRQGLRIGCLEEIAFRQGWIDREQLADLGKTLSKSEYGVYLRQLAEQPLTDEPAE